MACFLGSSGPAVFSLYAAAARFQSPGSTLRSAAGRAVASAARTGTVTRTAATPAHSQPVAVQGGRGGATGNSAEQTDEVSIPGGRLALMGPRTGPGDRGRRAVGGGRLESAGGDPDLEWLVGYATRYLEAARVCAGTSLSGPISGLLTASCWRTMCVYRRGVLPFPGSA